MKNLQTWGVSSGVKLRNSAKYLRELPLTEENMSMICNKFRLEYNVETNAVFIRTPFSRWIVHVKNNRVTAADEDVARKQLETVTEKRSEQYPSAMRS